MTAASAINNPALVASAGAVVFAKLPALQAACLSGTITWPVLKVANALLFALNIYAVTRPGRLDGESGSNNQEVDEVRALVNPAGWAFSIWGAIFLGEMVASSAALAVPFSSATRVALTSILPNLMAAQSLQILWTAAFRRKYLQQPVTSLIPPALLGASAFALSRAHLAFSTAFTFPPLGYLVFCLPIALHFGWMSAATLLNLNNNAAKILCPNPEDCPPSVVRVVNILGHVSGVVASAAGVALTVTRRAPVYGAVISWALTACTSTLRKWQEKAAEKPKKAVQTAAIRVQLWLSRIGAVASAAASVVAAGMLAQGAFLDGASP